MATISYAEAERTARDLMDSKGLRNWHFKWNRSVRAFGNCDYGRRTIHISKPLFDANTEEQFYETMIHEMAHAMTPGDGHGKKWRATYISMGGSGNRLADGNEVPSPLALVCQHCGKRYPRYRITKNTHYYCGRCRHRDYLVWEKDGRILSDKETTTSKPRR